MRVQQKSCARKNPLRFTAGRIYTVILPSKDGKNRELICSFLPELVDVLAVVHNFQVPGHLTTGLVIPRHSGPRRSIRIPVVKLLTFCRARRGAGARRLRSQVVGSYHGRVHPVVGELPGCLALRSPKACAMPDKPRLMLNERVSVPSKHARTLCGAEIRRPDVGRLLLHRQTQHDDVG